MAKPDLWSCVKFKRLCRDLDLPRPYIIGLLETLWQSAYATANPSIGNADDVECIAEWPGERGKLVSALVNARFIDADDTGYYVHDLEDHAPEYVKKKIARRRDKTADNGGQRRTTASDGGRAAENGGLPTPPTHPTLPTPPTLTSESEGKPKFKSADIETLYNAYPRHVGKGVAVRAIQQALVRLIDQQGDPMLFLLDRVEAYAKSPAGNAGQYTPHPATWFNQQRYLDDPEQWKNTKGSNNGNGPGKTNGHSQQMADARRAAERAREYHDPATDVA